jgi:phage replication-related protein YjqB (UPF0714/DUF867 family)
VIADTAAEKGVHAVNVRAGQNFGGAQGFQVEIHPSPNLQGLDVRNVCNRGDSGAGVQFELSKGLRRSFFRSLSRTGRQFKTERFWDFVVAVKGSIS